jgi:hypothetical protein
MTEIHIEGADEVIAKLSRFRFATMATEAVDTVMPAMVTALQVAAPRRTGRFAASIWGRRESSTTAVDAVFSAHVPYAKFVVEPTASHVIRARNAKALHWVGGSLGPGDHFAASVNHPGTKGNRFAHGVWLAMREEVIAELATRARLMLGG